nr:unnamed protein product [Callosobruchus chinensis]
MQCREGQLDSSVTRP